MQTEDGRTRKEMMVESGLQEGLGGHSEGLGCQPKCLVGQPEYVGSQQEGLGGHQEGLRDPCGRSQEGETKRWRNEETDTQILPV